MENNIPAFPCGKETYTKNGDNLKMIDDGRGMTLRDYFAAKAMMGFLSGRYKAVNDKATEEKERLSVPTGEQMAEWSYDFADAMLIERNKPTNVGDNE